MASTAVTTGSASAAATGFEVDFTAPIQGDQAAFAARPVQRGTVPWMAVQVERGWPARARELALLADRAIPNILLPAAQGPAVMPNGQTGYFVFCPAPPGPPVTAVPRPWPESRLLECVVRPVAAALKSLQALGVTHRAIRPGNLFQAGPGDPVTLGCAWAAPPGRHQPAWLEPPYAAVCLPGGCGPGSIADDIYALGALLASLAIGDASLAVEDDEAITRRKLDLGSYAALVGARRLPTGLAELIRGMLADDPDHRPSPALLCDPQAARARRLASKPARRAPVPLAVATVDAFTARSFAFAVLRHPEQALAALRTPAFDTWLRRGIGDVKLVGQVDELFRLRAATRGADPSQADAMLLAGLAAIFDPLAPLTWRGRAVWPDGLGTALDQALHIKPTDAAALAEIVDAEVVPVWASLRPDRCDEATLRAEARQHRHVLVMPHPAGGTFRLAYALNSSAPCLSPVLGRRWVVTVADILPALEEAAGLPGAPPVLLDEAMLTFIATRQRDRSDTELPSMAQAAMSLAPLSQLAVLARLQARMPTGALSNLARSIAASAAPVVDRYASASRRSALRQQVAELAEAGFLAPMFALLTSESEQANDRDGRTGALARVAAIDRALQEMGSLENGAGSAGLRVGQDVGTGLGLLALAFATAVAIFA